jgi:hypothetical protein
MDTRSTRRAPRHALKADVVVTDWQSGIHISERTKDLNLFGCGIRTAIPFATEVKVMFKVTYGQEKVTLFDKVIYGRRDIGRGIVFTTSAPEDQKLLEAWLADLAVP